MSNLLSDGSSRDRLRAGLAAVAAALMLRLAFRPSRTAALLLAVSLLSTAILHKRVRQHAAAVAAAPLAGVATYAGARLEAVQRTVLRVVDARLDALMAATVAEMRRNLLDPDMPAALQAVLLEGLHRAAADVRGVVRRRMLQAVETPLREKFGLSLAALAPRPPPPQLAASTAPRLERTSRMQQRHPPRSWAAWLRHHARHSTRATAWLSIAERAAETLTAAAIDARAALLYATTPYDRSMWRLFKSRAWWATTLLGLLPAIVSYPFWLLLYLCKDTGDEHQLADFITSFTASKFISNGVVSLAVGSCRYYLCVTFPSWVPCEDFQPQMAAVDVAFFLLQLVLVFAAFARLRHLPQSIAAAEGRHHHQHQRSTLGIVADAYKRRGGALHAMYFYLLFVACWVLACGVCALLFDVVMDGMAASPEDAPAAASTGTVPPRPRIFGPTAYWLRALFGICCLPFVAFKAPLVARLYIGSTPTGYDRRGVLRPVEVVHEWPAPPPAAPPHVL